MNPWNSSQVHFSGSSRTDGQTDGVTALLDLLSPLATQVKTEPTINRISLALSLSLSVLFKRSRYLKYQLYKHSYVNVHVSVCLSDSQSLSFLCLSLNSFSLFQTQCKLLWGVSLSLSLSSARIFLSWLCVTIYLPLFLSLLPLCVFKSPESLSWPIAMGWRPSSLLTSSSQELLDQY